MPLTLSPDSVSRKALAAGFRRESAVCVHRPRNDYDTTTCKLRCSRTAGGGTIHSTKTHFDEQGRAVKTERLE